MKPNIKLSASSDSECDTRSNSIISSWMTLWREAENIHIMNLITVINYCTILSGPDMYYVQLAELSTHCNLTVTVLVSIASMQSMVQLQLTAASVRINPGMKLIAVVREKHPSVRS